MDRERIIEGAKKNKAKGAEFENAVDLNGTSWGLLAADMMALIVLVVRWYGKGTYDFGELAIFATILGVEPLVKGIRLKRWWQILFGALFTLFALVCLICFLGEVFL